MENNPNFENPKIESISSQHFAELTPEIVNVDYDLWTLRITLSFSKINKPVVYVIFKNVIGFRLLDEGSLLEFWGKGRANGWLWKVKSGGWFDLERSRKGFVEGYIENESREEYLVAGINDCLNVIALNEPEIIVPE